MNSQVATRINARLRIAGRFAHWRIMCRDLTEPTLSTAPDREHLRAAIDWLCRAQDVAGAGVSGGYYFSHGWDPAYPETTGYIIPTFLRYSRETGDESYLERAIRMGDWEIAIQLPDGGVRGGVGVNNYAIVFNTGQVILGWCTLHRDTGQSRFLDAAIRAADWLVSIQDPSGLWIRHTYLGRSHDYHTRVAWPLLEVYHLTGREAYHTAALRTIATTTERTTVRGWFPNMGFHAGEVPLTHTIAYTLRGLLESALLLEEDVQESAVEIVRNAAERLLVRFELNKPDPYSPPGFPTARFDEHWKPAARYSCLTGNCQIALLWMKLYRLTDDARFLNSSLKMIDLVKSTQSLSSRHPGIRGGIAGSFPIWGGYAPYAYPNWPAKFFADAIMLQEALMQPLERSRT